MVDTNVVLRLLMRDDESQFVKARALLLIGFSVPTTVFLEAAWVLKSFYKQDRAQIAALLRQLIDTLGVHCTDKDALRVAISLFANGADINDVVHLVASRGADAFLTFDRSIPQSDAIGVPVELID